MESRFDERATGTEPTRSGVIGLLAAAVGLSRIGPIGRLAELRMGVRVDRPGVLLRDFQTVQWLEETSSVRGGKVDGIQRTRQPAPAAARFYLADAAFTVALEHADRTFLIDLAHAVLRPRFILSLGRRTCLPAEPLVTATTEGGPLITDEPMEAALLHAPVRAGDNRRFRFVVETGTLGEVSDLGRPLLLETRYDVPVQDAFSPVGRQVRLSRTVGIFDRQALPVSVRP
jgi:CRISPR system Cascade subunit CasD